MKYVLKDYMLIKIIVKHVRYLDVKNVKLKNA